MEWEETVAALRSELELKHEAREAALKQCRTVVQLCSKAIKCVHRDEHESAHMLIEEARILASQTRHVLSSFSDLLFAGYVQDAEKELVEAAMTYAIVTDSDWPSAYDFGVSAQTYLNGAGEAASELRRYALDKLRAGDLDEAERLLGIMEGIYDDLTTFDFPDSLTGGLRRTCDALRAVVERTRSDLTMTRVQHDLMVELRHTHSH